MAQVVSGAETAGGTVAWGEREVTGGGTRPVICAILGSGEVRGKDHPRARCPNLYLTIDTNDAYTPMLGPYKVPDAKH
jgi:hypothetical protein